MSYSSSIDIIATASYSGSTVAFYKDALRLESTGADIPLTGGTQSAFTIEVTNQESGIQMKYGITLIRPLPACAATELTAW